MRLGRAVIGAVVLSASGCIRTYDTQVVDATMNGVAQEPLRSVTNLPPSFTVITPGSTPADCPVRLRDEGLRTALTLVRTLRIPIRDSDGSTYVTYGDYSVQPVGAYGDSEGDALRVDCAGLRPLGVVQIDVRQPT